MSHQPERQEKNCLNCGTTVHGRYCHVCGQENLETRESFWSLSRHFVFDILHFDGKFFYTFKYLFTRPGYVPRQYAEGKRATYLHPIRMYLFTSAVFFLVFFSPLNSININSGNGRTKLSKKERLDLADIYENSRPGDTAMERKLALLRDTSRPVNFDSLHLPRTQIFTVSGSRQYFSMHEYDSVQNKLPPDDRDGWFRRKMIRRSLEINEKYKTDKEGGDAFIEKFLHQLPYLLFISLPFFALILKLLYVRRKNFYYSDHAIFTLYHYILSFILLLFIVLIGAIEKQVNWDWLSYLTIVILLSWPVYLMLELKNFYRQGWGKTIGKFILLNLLGMLVVFILFFVFFLFSIFQM